VAVRCCAHGVQAAASGSRSSPFGADRRLTGRSAFEPLLREGKRRSISGYTFYVARRSEGAPRLGILVTRRHAARATERNRIKRCIREAFRLEQRGLGSVDVLVRPPYGARGSASMLERLRELFRNLET
jgi:ribonuclease P protein component